MLVTDIKWLSCVPETLNSVYVEKYRMEEMIEVVESEDQRTLQRLSAQLKGSSVHLDNPPSS